MLKSCGVGGKVGGEVGNEEGGKVVGETVGLGVGAGVGRRLKLGEVVSGDTVSTQNASLRGKKRSSVLTPTSIFHEVIFLMPQFEGLSNPPNVTSFR